MISGVLFLNPFKEIRIDKIYKYYLKRIFVAFVFWSFLYMLYGIVMDFIVNGFHTNFAILIKEHYLSFLYGRYHMWYLFMLMGLYLVTPLLRKIMDSKKMIQYFLILSFIFGFGFQLIEMIPIIGDIAKKILIEKAHFTIFSSYTGYFVLGYYLHRYDLKIKIRKIIYILAIVGLTFTIIGTTMWSLKTNQLENGLYNYLLPNILCMSIAVFLIVKYHFYQKKAKAFERSRIIGKISQLSLGMYLIHDFFIIYIENTFLDRIVLYPSIGIPLLTVIVFLMSFLVVYCINKIPYINKYIV